MRLLQLPANLTEVLKTKLHKQVEALFNKGKLSANSTFAVKADVKSLLQTDLEFPKQTILFQAMAWTKLQMLTYANSSEVAANCLVFRNPECPDEYIVYDVLVYPQIVTAATAETADNYGLWLNELDDESFNDCRMQWHSHVHMSSSPSGVDFNNMETLTAQVKDYYIFAISNKRSEFHFTIYDVARNVIFENTDISYDILLDETTGQCISDWLNDSKKQLTQRTFTPPVTSINRTYNYTQKELEDMYQRGDY